jgi:hypothetical protein
MIAALRGAASEPPADLDFALVERSSTAPPA